MSPDVYKQNTTLLKQSNYIFISNFPYLLEKPYYFGETYHKKLAQWIKTHFKLIARAGHYELIYNDICRNYGFLIYKRKE